MRRRTRVGVFIVLRFGLAVMATSRPFEGFVLTMVLVGAALVWSHNHHPLDRVFSAVCADGYLPAGPSGPSATLTDQSRAVTGSPFKLPHELYRHEEAIWPDFVFERPRTNAVYRHEVLRKFFEEWEPEFEDAKDWGTLKGLIPGLDGRLRMVGACYFPLAPYAPIALLSLVAVSFRKTRLLGAAICASLAADGLANWTMPHYLARPFLER